MGHLKKNLKESPTQQHTFKSLKTKHPYKSPTHNRTPGAYTELIAYPMNSVSAKHNNSCGWPMLIQQSICKKSQLNIALKKKLISFPDTTTRSSSSNIHSRREHKRKKNTIELYKQFATKKFRRIEQNRFNGFTNLATYMYSLTNGSKSCKSLLGRN